jgi:hypothetical protein
LKERLIPTLERWEGPRTTLCGGRVIGVIMEGWRTFEERGDRERKFGLGCWRIVRACYTGKDGDVVVYHPFAEMHTKNLLPENTQDFWFDPECSGEPSPFCIQTTCTSPLQLARLHPCTEIELVLFAGADDSAVPLPPHLAGHITHTPADLLQLWITQSATTSKSKHQAGAKPRTHLRLHNHILANLGRSEEVDVQVPGEPKIVPEAWFGYGVR